MAKEKTFALAKGLLRYDRLNPKSNKAARAQSSNDEVTLDKRRLDYQHEGNELKAIIETIQDLQRDSIKLSEALTELRAAQLKLGIVSTDFIGARELSDKIAELASKKHQLEETQVALSNLASLRGYIVLHQGLALLIDCLTVEQYERDEDDRKKKTFMRVPISDLMFDCAQFMMQVDKRMKKQNAILNAMAVHSHAANVGEFIPIKDGKEIDELEPEDVEDELDEAAPEGVPVPEKMSKENVIRLVRDPKKETPDATGAERP